MKKYILIIATMTALALVWASCEPKRPEALKEDPITTLGHGDIFGQDGKPLQLDEKLIEQMQGYYINYLSSDKLKQGEGADFDSKKAAEIRKIIDDEVKDRILGNAIYLDYLIEHKKPQENGRYPIINNALRWYYVLNLAKDKVLPDKERKWYLGLTKDIAERLRQRGIEVFAVTNSGSNAYCEECLAAGVPVPQNMFGPEWQNMGSFDGDEFISRSSDPQLMLKVSVDPPGFCLALPRYDGSNRAGLFGVICMSSVTSRVCFFDNPRGNLYLKDDVIDFKTNFVGGQDLVANGQGVCSDCHAGENPYIVHPEVAAFDNFIGTVGSTLPPQWHIPLVPGTWPQNPGPTYVLDGITSAGQCNSCHRPGNAGRFPRISALSGYCSEVMQNAVDVGTSPAPRTMPPYGADPADYAPHINALLRQCDKSIKEGESTDEIPPPANDPGFLSPPMVIGPLFDCATAVAVRGAVLDAKVTLLIDGVVVGTISPARNTTQLEFSGLAPLTVGASVTAIQEKDGATSAPSALEKVLDHKVVFPAGLPAPTIDPIVYECASLIAVQHVPGAMLTVYTNGANPRSWNTSTGYTAIWPSGAPFTLGMKFTVEVSLCTDVSPQSAPIEARRAPSMLIPPVLDPATVYNGQELVDVSGITYGALVTLQLSAVPWSGTLQTPITWFPDYDVKTKLGRPLNSGDFLQSMQGLCSTNSIWSPPGQKTHNCEQLPAARIDPPGSGDTFVSVYESVPGARIMVYDNANNEIGDGSGTIINLSRPLVAGEQLRVVQRLRECTSRFVFLVSVGS